MSGPERRSPLDGPAARVVAFAVALAGVAFLAWVHRADLFPADPDTEAADPQTAAFQACFGPQAARIAQDAGSGQLTEAQAKLFRSRAEAFCADQAAKGGQ